MKMAILAVLAPSIVIKLFTAIACSLPVGLASLNNAGPHGFSEILYAFSSAAGNNGSAFAGLNTNTVFYNLMMDGKVIFQMPAHGMFQEDRSHRPGIPARFRWEGNL